ncbi:adrenodoxin, mitochondrial [Geospiza fortis]|uniref:Adrenal ferredoxin n=1 Tax=Geospiza fortis TaxID=48883 RepID=A0A8N5HZ01_GEOFO|nr:adrenodoxin, mitochondrial [Geospiza fortis]
MLLYTNSTSSPGAHVAQQRCANAPRADSNNRISTIFSMCQALRRHTRPQKRSRGTDTATGIADGNKPERRAAIHLKPDANQPQRLNYLKLRKCHSLFSSEDKITVHFINRDGDKLTAKGKPGDSLLDVVVNNNLDIDGFGACEGTLACSTCHLIFEDHIFEKLDAITDEEMDMLDLAYGLTETSRLGCQICLKKSMNDMTVRVPEAVADVRQSVDMSKNS